MNRAHDNGLSQFKNDKRSLAKNFFENFQIGGGSTTGWQKKITHASLEHTIKLAGQAGHDDLNLAGTQAVIWMGIKRSYRRFGVNGPDKGTYAASLDYAVNKARKK